VWARVAQLDIRLKGRGHCIPVRLRAIAKGSKELIAVAEVYWEDNLSWKEL
jgi:hypothetical protein